MKTGEKKHLIYASLLLLNSVCKTMVIGIINKPQFVNVVHFLLSSNYSVNLQRKLIVCPSAWFSARSIGSVLALSLYIDEFLSVIFVGDV